MDDYYEDERIENINDILLNYRPKPTENKQLSENE